MKHIIDFNKTPGIVWRPYGLAIKSIVLLAFIMACIHAPAQAQETRYVMPSWWFGASAAANFNYHYGTIQQLNASFATPSPFGNSDKVGLYLAPHVEYHHPDSRWGVILQAGYDGRRAHFKEQLEACNCPAELEANLQYITLEPSLRFAPFKTGFYLYGGPRFAFSLDKASSFTYRQGIDPDFPEADRVPDVSGNFSNFNKSLISMQLGAGYDIQLSSAYNRGKVIFSPFVSFHPYFGQSPRSSEYWNLTTLRVGAAFKFGRGHSNPAPAQTPVFEPVSDPAIRFTVNSPQNIPVDRRVRETFPLLNYVFFDEGSTEIPKGYVLLRKGQVKDFKEDQLEVLTPKDLSGRSNRGMIVYYNVLNIIGDRLGQNPSSTINLVGSSPQHGIEDGKAMAESVKRYLVDVFGISAIRINTEGRVKPELPSEKPGSTLELGLLREGDRRVSIESSSPALLMEFQTGPNASLKPVEINAMQEAPVDSYVTFTVEGGREAFSSWRLEVRDANGVTQSFGPFTREIVSIPGKSILGTRPKGNYIATMIGQTKNGRTIRREASVNMVLWVPAKDELGMRYSILFGFDESKAIAIYDKYLTEIVTPKIPKGSKVIIHGHTDIIGTEAYNQKLSLDRANEVKNILAASLSKAGRNDVRFDVRGFGEDESLAPYGNYFPEERFYNRTVIIDIIPPKP